MESVRISQISTDYYDEEAESFESRANENHVLKYFKPPLEALYSKVRLSTFRNWIWSWIRYGLVSK